MSARIQLKKGIVAGLPIATGYLPMAISFGVLAVQAGISLGDTLLMSALVYGGASQFMAVNMVTLNSLGMEIVLATFVLNLRHFIMSMSFLNRFPTLGRSWQLLLTLGITDESFAMSSLAEIDDQTADNRYYLLGLMLTAYLSWFSGTAIGGALAMIVPPEIGSSMSIALYAMFVGLLVPAVRNNWRKGLLALSGALLCTFFQRLLPSGWAIVWATILASLLGVFVLQEDDC